jgi:hypothetical protein
LIDFSRRVAPNAIDLEQRVERLESALARDRGAEPLGLTPRGLDVDQRRPPRLRDREDGRRAAAAAPGRVGRGRGAAREGSAASAAASDSALRSPFPALPATMRPETGA